MTGLQNALLRIGASAMKALNSSKMDDGFVCVSGECPMAFLVSTTEDVSEQMRRDAELSDTRQQAELAQHILDNLATPIVVKDSSLRYVTVNEAFCRIPGLPPKHLIGRSAKELVSPELARQFDTIERKVLDTGVPYEAAEDITRRDGSIMHVVTRIRRSGSPGKYYITVSFDDISGYVQPQNSTAETPSEPQNPPPESGSQARNTERILVLHADKARGERRVATLKGDGSDALVLCQAAEAFAFLAQAEEMQLRIDRVELCAAMAAELASHEETTRYPVLLSALKSWSATAANKTVLPSRPGEPESSLSPQQPECETRSVLSAPEPEPASVSEDPIRPPEPLPGSKTNPAPGGVANRLRVLVAEDNHVNQIVFEQILEGIDADFRIVSNGEEAFAAWQSSAPDLILMDVSMPVMNGLQATQAIRKAEGQETEGKARTPIIAVTAHAMGGDRERCLDAGMDDYLSKPVSPDKLEAIIAKWVETARLGDEDSGTCLS
jgi:PAS domain S-box-containing protein